MSSSADGRTRDAAGDRPAIGRSPPPILVADVGGTHARFAVALADGPKVTLRSERVLDSRSFAGLGEALAAYLDLAPEARQAVAGCFALAGPVDGGRCELTNLGWSVEADEIGERLPFGRPRLVNDLQAGAAGIASVPDDLVVELQAGVPRPTANRALLAPGTGFGQAFLVWDGERHRALASEGGHADFAPRDDLQIELWRFLTARYRHASLERILSGPGLVTIHRFVLEREGRSAPAWLEEDGAAARIARDARSSPEALAAASVDLFCELLGAEAGNVALRSLATGGVYLAGGVVQHLLPELQHSRLLDVFADKGRLADLLRTVPVRVVLDDRVSLYGAALLGLAPPTVSPPVPR